VLGGLPGRHTGQAAAQAGWTEGGWGTRLVHHVRGVAARARVHRPDQGAARRIGERGGSAGEGELPVLQRLAHHLQHLPLKLGQLVQEKDAVMGEVQLPQPGNGTAANQPCIGDGMVGRAEGAGGDQRRISRQQAADRVGLGASARRAPGASSKEFFYLTRRRDAPLAPATAPGRRDLLPQPVMASSSLRRWWVNDRCFHHSPDRCTPNIFLPCSGWSNITALRLRERRTGLEPPGALVHGRCQVGTATLQRVPAPGVETFDTVAPETRKGVPQIARNCLLQRPAGVAPSLAHSTRSSCARTWARWGATGRDSR
jgi:hypothetical protein